MPFNNTRINFRYYAKVQDPYVISMLINAIRGKQKFTGGDHGLKSSVDHRLVRPDGGTSSRRKKGGAPLV